MKKWPEPGEAFNRAVSLILDLEGPPTDDPNDPGGYTKFGISQRAFPHIDVKKLTIDEAKDLYAHWYWQPSRCADMPWPLSLFVFDCAVNQGPGAAAKLLQEALGVQVDGKVGAKTMAAAVDSGPEEWARFMALRVQRYAATKGFETYGLGWLKRTYFIAMEA